MYVRHVNVEKDALIVLFFFVFFCVCLFENRFRKCLNMDNFVVKSHIS